MVQLKRKVTLREKHEERPDSIVQTESQASENPNVMVVSETSRATTSPDVKSDGESKSKVWIPILLCGLLIIGIGIYFLTRSSKGDDTIASTDVNKETSVQSNEEVISPASEIVPISDENTSSVDENKDQKPDEASTIVENRGESSKSDNFIVENQNSFGSTTDTRNSNVRSESIPVSEIERTAKEVIRGKYGNGRIRKDKLGDQYSEIQSKVNEMYRKGF